MKYLITSSLLDSFDWLKSCPKSWQQKALDDFVAMIRREPRPTSEACQRGIDFENLICKNCNEMNADNFGTFVEDYWHRIKNCKDDDLENAVWVTEKIAEECKGGSQQVAVMKDITVDNHEYHLFGYADIIQPKKIIDIKTTGNYKGDESYLKRSQHYLYSLCTGIKEFEYLIADFGRKKYPQELYKVIINLEEQDCYNVLENRIRNCVQFLENAGLWSDYVEKFTKGHKDIKQMCEIYYN